MNSSSSDGLDLHLKLTDSCLCSVLIRDNIILLIYVPIYMFSVLVRVIVSVWVCDCERLSGVVATKQIYFKEITG